MSKFSPSHLFLVLPQQELAVEIMPVQAQPIEEILYHQIMIPTGHSLIH
jgi:hypothetical protein